MNFQQNHVAAKEFASLPSLAASHPTANLKFARNNEFQVELHHEVDQYFKATGKRQRDCPAMYVKSALIFGSFALFYWLLVFVAQTWWQALPLAVLLAFPIAGIGFSVQHDGGHHAYSRYAWINKLMSMSLDLVGGSSYMWHWKHAVFHHTYVNIDGHDTDIDLGMLARLTPHQKRRSFHRWQHFYIWLLYGVMAIRWHMFGDFKELVTGRIGAHKFPRPKGWELALFIAGKSIFFSLAFVIPLLMHTWWVVFLFYGVVAIVLGAMLSIVFQLAHCVEEAEFPLPDAESHKIEAAWAVHQAQTTVDFARSSRIVAWLLGGLNFQIEHHLFPRICHVNYPALAKIVEKTCRQFGVRYVEHKTFWSGLASHFLWLRRMGRGDQAGGPSA
jgi:linoleoyl-CoA desaturase